MTQLLDFDRWCVAEDEAEETTKELPIDAPYATGLIPLTREEYAKLPHLKRNSSCVRSSEMIPSWFDARQKWPRCSSIRTIRVQGGRGTCWAVSGSGVMSDRVCTASEQNIDVTFSSNQAASCTYLDKTPNQK
ncbi:hypothetical protein RvY_04624 [Ramazzottius varieornatus]|uniref:Peptidase C1A papain C-terminal domain-containing protein n=1 Tax=Ramazzottius varieornatus TaxID=947166 RepID=A0A1D1UVK6_RAMVA|nr:hypothetical protein RvY_04624 [Ramazzottius varieornatus]